VLASHEASWWHPVRACVRVCVPAAHFVHAVARTPGDTEPGGHSSQEEPFTLEVSSRVPTGQTWAGIHVVHSFAFSGALSQSHAASLILRPSAATLNIIATCATLSTVRRL
jgi:hypothetical protein